MGKTNQQKDQDLAVQTALNLAQATQKTAEALANAKVQSDIKAAEMAIEIKQISSDVKDIKMKLDEKYTTKEDHQILIISNKDHELRLRRLETWIAMAVGALVILNVVLKFFVKSS